MFSRGWFGNVQIWATDFLLGASFINITIREISFAKQKIFLWYLKPIKTRAVRCWTIDKDAIITILFSKSDHNAKTANEATAFLHTVQAAQKLSE